MAEHGYVLTSNEAIVGICVGTEAEANAFCRQFSDAYAARQAHEYGELAPFLSRTMCWEARKAPIVQSGQKAEPVKSTGNAVVKYITEHGGFDPKHLALLDFPEADLLQYAQLLGLSVHDQSIFVDSILRNRE